MTNYRKIEKGTVLGWDWFYVVVNASIFRGKLWLHCICDNANNIYAFEMDEILNTTEPSKWLVIDPYTAMQKEGWDWKLTDEDEAIFDKMGRPIPVDVIAEVLAGLHDDRFDDELRDVE